MDSKKCSPHNYISSLCDLLMIQYLRINTLRVKLSCWKLRRQQLKEFIKFTTWIDVDE